MTSIVVALPEMVEQSDPENIGTCENLGVSSSSSSLSTAAFKQSIVTAVNYSNHSINVKCGRIPFDNVTNDPAYHDIEFEVVTNDHTDESVVKLIALKNIFSRQLPKMPKEYIVRLVFDYRHYSLAIKKQDRIIGGICYRPYFEQRFGEIAFCAINSTEQVKGFGTMLMNQLKSFVQPHKLEYFLTYADNFAIGYFQKQGFSKSITMPRERWVGYIKDYDGGTLMECYIHPAVNYVGIKAMISKQRNFILSRFEDAQQQSAQVFEGLHSFKLGKRLHSILELPGVEEAGWTAFHIYHTGGDHRTAAAAQTRMHNTLKGLFEKLRSIKSFKIFNMYPQAPSNTGLVDLNYILEQLKSGDYYRSKESLGAELQRMVESSKQYIPNTSENLESLTQVHAAILEIFYQKDANAANNDT